MRRTTSPTGTSRAKANAYRNEGKMSTVLREVLVPAREGRAIEVHAGEHLSLIDVEGSQVADFVAIHRTDPHRFVSVQQTRTRIFRYNLAVGDLLVDVHYEPFFELVRDDVG